MFKITSGLKAHAIAHLGCKAWDSDATIRKAVNKAVKSKKLATGKLLELAGKSSSRPSEVASALKDGMTGPLESWARSTMAGIGAMGPLYATQATADQVKTFVEEAVHGGRLSMKQFNALMGREEKSMTDKKKPATKGGKPSKKAMGVIGGKGTGGIRVKNESEKYSTKQYTGKHAKTGMPVIFNGKEVQTNSELTKAKMGVWFKFQAIKSGLPWQGGGLSEHERALLNEMIHTETFCRVLGNDSEELLKGAAVKALLDDSTSGGLYLAPITFDDAITTFPLLNGELFPFVDVKDVPRGRRIETGSLGNPTVTWGTAEGTAITAFTTTALAAQITSTVFPIQVAVEVGNDFLSDAAVNVGSYLEQNIGQVFLKELDGVIGTGDGTTQPQGLTVATGQIAVSSDNSTSGPPTLSDYESLYFGLPKQYRRDEWNHCFVGNDVSYRRFCGIPVGPTDERRVGKPLGDQGNYMALNRPFRVAQSFTNSQLAYVALKKYRMWRREGLETRWTREGNYLSLRNLSLLVVRSRYAGKLLDGTGMALISDGQA